MSFARAVDRARTNFLDRPGLELTVPQAVHLWRLGLDDCRYVIDALIDAGFLKWTTSRTIVRADQQDNAGIAWDRAQVAVRRASAPVRHSPHE